MSTLCATIISTVLVTLLAAGLAAAGQAPTTAPDKNAIVIVHFGDSHCITSYLPKEQRIDAVLNAKLAARYRGQKIVNVNVGRDGETDPAFLDGRYEKDVKAKLPRIDIALLRHRVMDSGRVKQEEFKAIMEEMCDRLLKDYPGVTIVLETNRYTGGKSLVDNYNKHDALYDDVLKKIAADRKYLLVDNAARRKKEVEAGNWDQCIRSQTLSLEKFGHRIVDDSKDKEMEGVAGWFGDTHPNPNAVNIMADEEFKVFIAAWPKLLPKAGAGSGAAASQPSTPARGGR